MSPFLQFVSFLSTLYFLYPLSWAWTGWAAERAVFLIDTYLFSVFFARILAVCFNHTSSTEIVERLQAPNC